MPYNVPAIRNKNFEMIAYDLFDTFKTDVAAGSVNGTLAAPAGGVRTVVDTASKLSISGGLLRITSTTVSGGTDPKISWPAITRKAGKMMLWEDKFVSYTYAGFSTKSDRIISYFVLDAEASITVYTTTSLFITVADGTYVQFAPLSQAVYKYVIVLRGTGAFYFIKGGIYTYWTMLYPRAQGSTATLYPSISRTGGQTQTWDNVRIPSALWLPVPLISDGFSGATSDGLGHAEANGGSGKVWTGATWTVSGGKVSNTPTLGPELSTGALVVGNWYSITATQANYFYTGCAVADTFRALATTALDANNKVKLITTATMFLTTPATNNVIADCISPNYTLKTQAGLVIGLDDATTPANFLIAHLDGSGKAVVEQCLAGTYTTIVTAATAAFGAAKVLRVSKDGTAVRLYYNDVLIGNGTCHANITGTLVGMFTPFATNTFDNFVCWARGNNNEYSILDKF